MRQLGTLKDQRDAERFAAWLVAQRIEAQAEEGGEAGWAIWVRDEDQLPKAREAFVHFQANPQDPRYANAERAAAELVRQEEAKRREAQKNVVQMRSRWGNPASSLTGGMPKRCPLVMAIIVGAILVTLATNFGDEPAGGLSDGLLFSNPSRAARTPAGGDLARANMWTSVRQGEIWRLVTPILLHFDWMHLIMNVIVLYTFGGQIETHRGTRFMLALVLVLAISSNLGQAVEATWRETFSKFGGLSGVGYGVFGYLLIKTKYDNKGGYLLSPVTSFLMLLWFFLCIGGEFPPLNTMLPQRMTQVANSAHAVGLLVGAAWAYAPLLLRKPA